ncbi:MAG: serine hydrolase [Streptococcaceae bacterium]|nr:serine hydrolase [Streptococcaceae bacterium]
MLVILVLPAFFVPKAPAKREIVREQPKPEYLSVIPERAVSLQNVTIYKDAALSQVAGKLSAQTQLSIKKLSNHAFELTNGDYISAKGTLVGSDVTLTTEKSTVSVFTTHTVNVLYSPWTTYEKEVYSTVGGGLVLSTLKKANTHWGTYYEVNFDNGRTGWVSAKDVSLEDPRILALQKSLNEKYGHSGFSITVKELDSSFTVGVNMNTELYAASLAKVPVLYWTQKELNDGDASLSDQLRYLPAVNERSWGAFETDGTGTLPKVADGKLYSLQDVINRTAKESDNVGSNLLAYYEAGKFDAAERSAVSKLMGRTYDPVARNASSLMIANALLALYNEGGACYNALIGTSYDNEKIAAGVPAGVLVAHKIGDAGSYNHDAAIVWGKTPYVLVVMTNGGSDGDITGVSQMVWGALE